jgi:hypothetical protein
MSLLAAIAIPNFIRVRTSLQNREAVTQGLLDKIGKQLVAGAETIYLTNNWYYIRAVPNRDIGSQISDISSQISKTNPVIPALVYSLACYDGKQIEAFNPRLHIIQEHMGLTNGYFVAFRPLVLSRQGVELETTSTSR